MPIDWGPVIAAGISGGASLLGGSAANDANKTIARETNSYAYSMWKAGNQFSAAQAKASRDWSRLMSNTAIQRQMRDMRQAGINPILAGKYGGSAFPAPATAGSISVPGLQVARMQDVLTPAVNTAISAYSAAKQGQKTTAETEMTKQQTDKLRVEASRISSQEVLNQAQTQAVYIGLQKITEEVNMIRSRTNLNEALVVIPELVGDLVRGLRELGNIQTPESLNQALQETAEALQHVEVRQNDSPRWGISFSKEPSR